MNTFESGVKRRDRKFPLQSCLRRVSAQRGEAYRFLRNAARKVAPSGPGTAGPEGGLIRLPDQLPLPGQTSRIRTAAFRPASAHNPFSSLPSCAHPKRDAADRQNRLPAFTHPPTDAQRHTLPARVPTDHKRGNAPDPHPHALPGRRNGAILAIRAHQAKPVIFLRYSARQIYEPLLAYMNKQALAHEFSYANLYSQNIRRFARKTSMHEVKRLLAFNARPRRSNRCRS